MQIKNFNQAAPHTGQGAEPHAPEAGDSLALAAPGETPAPASDPEVALLRARIEHLELVVETARSLMTSNQERLLRRLHDVPQEMMALTARIARLDASHMSHHQQGGPQGALPDALRRVG